MALYVFGVWRGHQMEYSRRCWRHTGFGVQRDGALAIVAGLALHRYLFHHLILSLSAFP
jgi:hypothetical protein